MPLSKPNLIKPRIGGDLDVWGGKLNENIDKQDAFNASIVEDSSIKDQELSRLEMEKVDKDELNTFVKDVVDNYIEDNVKPELNNHVETVNKPDIDNYVSGKKSELNQYVETVSKIEINNYTDEKKSEINNYTILKKTELNEHTETKKTEINDYTLVKKTELDEYEKEKELELNNFTTTKKEEITSHTNNEISNITNHTESKKIEINDYTNTKKDELNSHTTDKKNELNIYVDTVNKVSLDEHEKEKEKELDLYNTNIKKPELDTYEKEKEKELKSYADTLTVEKNQEITNHTNEEIERVIGAGLDGVWGEINNKLNKDDSAKSAIKLATARKINGVNFDGTSDIVVKAYPVPEAIVNDLTTGGTDTVLSGEMGKLLKELIEAGGGGTNFNYVVKTNPNGVITASGILTKGTSNIAPNTPAIFKPMLFIEGDLVPENLYSINESGTLIKLNFVYSNDVDAEWFIYDHFPSETKFSIATVNLLVNSPLKNGLELGDVIRIQGELSAYDGGAHLRIVENSAKLNAVDLGGGLWLNEVPQSRVSNKRDSTNKNFDDYIELIHEGRVAFLAKTGDNLYNLDKTNNDNIWKVIFDSGNSPFYKNWDYGYFKTPNGLIIQFGITSVLTVPTDVPRSASQSPNITFPIAFTTSTPVVLGSHRNSRYSSGWVATPYVSNSGFTLSFEYYAPSSSLVVNWIAIGY